MGGRENAKKLVTDILGARVDEFDVHAIVNEIHEHTGGVYDVKSVKPEDFWTIVGKHQTAPQ